MGAFDIVFRYVPALQVCRSRLVPVAQSCEDVRWHVESMRHRRGGLRICSSRLLTQLCMFRIVIRVNEIVQDAWMVRLVRVHLFEQLCGLALSFESLGPLRNSAEDRQPIEQLRFVIWIFGVYGRHGIAV